MARAELTIIGAGPAGLAAARHAVLRGVKPVVIDRAEGPGGAWRVMPDALRLISPRWENALPGRPLPPGPPLVTRAEYLDYLVDYAATIDAEFRYGTPVTRLRHDSQGFVLESGASTLETKRLLVATGIFGGPSPVTVPGLDVIHPSRLRACDFRNAAPFGGQRVLILGGGNSGVGIARDLVQAGVATTLSSNVPLPTRPVSLPGQLSKVTGPVLQRIPVRWLPFLRFRIGVPSFVDAEFLAAVRSGALVLKPGVSRIEGNSAVFSDGSTVTFDRVIDALGYKPALAPIVEGLCTLDAHGQPLHRDGLSTEHRGLGFLSLPHQRTFVSQFLRGIARDAEDVVDDLLRT